MSFVVMLGHISFSGIRPVGPGSVCLWAGHFTQSCPVLIKYALFIVASSLCTGPDMVSSLISKQILYREETIGPCPCPRWGHPWRLNTFITNHHHQRLYFRQNYPLLWEYFRQNYPLLWEYFTWRPMATENGYK